MNKKQTKILWVFIVLIVLTIIFPLREEGHHLYYDFLFFTTEIEWERLALEWIFIGVVGGGLIYSYRTKKDSDG